MGTEKESITMSFSELFTARDASGNIKAKVEINIVSGEASNAQTYHKDTFVNNFLFRGFSIDQLKDKKIKVFVSRNTYILDNVV